MSRITIDLEEFERARSLSHHVGNDRVAAYLVVGSSPELTADKLAVFKRRADELLEHEIQVRRSVDHALGSADCPPHDSGRVDGHLVGAGAGDGSIDRHRSPFLDRLRQLIIKLRGVLSVVKGDSDAFPISCSERERSVHSTSPNYRFRIPDMRGETDSRRGSGGSPNAARHFHFTGGMR